MSTSPRIHAKHTLTENTTFEDVKATLLLQGQEACMSDPGFVKHPCQNWSSKG
jgi:hypothetical protein